MNTAVPQIIPNTKSKPTTATEHLLSSPNHTANDIRLIPIEKLFSNQNSCAAALDEEYISTYVLTTSKRVGFFVVFVSGVALVLFPRNNSYNF